MPMPKLIRILAVDGGGVGGIIPARILEQLHNANGDLINRADLVAGTSTGGLIALGLALGKTPAEMCRFYQEKAKTIFSKANRRVLAVRTFRAKFIAAGLRRAVEEIAPGLTLDDLKAKPVFIPVTAIVRPDQSHHPAGVFLSTAYRLVGDPTLEKSLEKYASGKWKCADVALATAAAPTYFPAHEVESPDPKYPGKWVCWDGGVVANNPALAATGEVYRLDFESRRDEYNAGTATPPEVRVLSLGTGYRNIDIGGGDWGLVQAARPVVQTLLDASVGSTAFLLRQFLGSRAVRVNVRMTKDYDIDDPEAIDRLDAAALDFVNNGIAAVEQPDKTTVDLKKWLDSYWYGDPPMRGPVAALAGDEHHVPPPGGTP
jgi:uncharacterized protein